MPAPRPLLWFPLALLPAGCAPPGNDGYDDPPPIVVHYRQTLACPRFLGHSGEYLVYEVVRVENPGDTAFAFRPLLLRFADGAHRVPALAVPEWTELEVPAGAEVAAAEPVLLQRTGSGPPPRTPMALVYAAGGVEMRITGEPPAYSEDACDGYAT